MMYATSLFTNVQIGLAHKAIKTRFNQIKTHTKISLSEFLIGIRACTRTSSFNFKGVLYKQISGFPMGSPLSPIISDIVMDDLKKECLSKLTFKLPFYFRYVDDNITAAPPDKIDTILNAFNNYNNKLKFTIEKESNNQISFLDVLLIPNGNTIKRNWYQKPTISNRVLNYLSHHPLKYKINVINNLIDRSIILANKEFHSENIKKIKTI